ncbi:hypothetical protein [Dolichospermum phage Dfl-JY45]
MAIYHLHVQTLSRGNGRSATAAAAYRAGERIVDVRTGEVHDYTRKGGVFHREILLPGGAPVWMLGRSQLWNAVELSEGRSDARVARELDVALPRELPRAVMLELGLGWVRAEAVSLGMVGDVCFHDLDGDNPHFHVLLTTREVNAHGFGAKVRSWDGWGRRSAPNGSLVDRWRQSWMLAANASLERAGRSERIDHRTLAEQGIDRPPTVHLGRWHAINRNARSPSPRPGLPPRAVPWSGTPLDSRDRRTRINASLRSACTEGDAWRSPSPVLAPVIARHLRRRLHHVESAVDLALAQRRAAFEPPDVEAWIARSRKFERLRRAAEAERVELEARRKAAESLRLFAAEEFARLGSPSLGVSTGDAQARLRSWLDRVRSRLDRWVSARVALAAEARKLLARCAEWRQAMVRAEAILTPIKRAGP